MMRTLEELMGAPTARKPACYFCDTPFPLTGPPTVWATIVLHIQTATIPTMCCEQCLNYLPRLAGLHTQRGAFDILRQMLPDGDIDPSASPQPDPPQ